MKTRVTRLMLDKMNLLSICVCALLLWLIKQSHTQSPAFWSPLVSGQPTVWEPDKKKREKKPHTGMRRTWKLHRDRNWKRKQSRLHGCAPVCSSTRCHEPGEARTDLGLKKTFTAGTIRWLSSCEWSFSSLPTDASARVVLTDGRDDIVVLNPHWLVSIFHPPPPLNSASQKQQRLHGSLCKQLKVALTCSTAEQSQAECVTEHFWVFSEPACCGVFGQEHYLLNLISCFLTGSNSNSGYKTAAAATVPTGFFPPPLLQLFSNTQLGTSEQLCLHWSV